jgi:wyosine [tRNA(Phe)-imidazoG37] synthetase (radical SAM superfamily)
MECREDTIEDGMSTRALDFKDHRRELDENRYVYAVVSRRARGLSIGVNLNTDKLCNFVCPYCQVDRRAPGGPSAVDVGRLGGELQALLDRVGSGRVWEQPPFDTVAEPLRHLADVAFSGDGEPTTPPEFPAAARAARAILDQRRLGVPLRLITNATMFDRPRVREALAHFDELWCKLDAGTEPYFQLVDGTRLPFAKVLKNLEDVARERPLVIQSMFLRYAGAPPSEAEIEAYVGRLRDLLAAGGKLSLVQVYTVARDPADPRCTPLPPAALEDIAAKVRGLGLAAEVYA